MKKTLIKVAIVIVVFVITIIITSAVVNQDFEDLTKEMTPATFPTVSIEYNGTEINRMYGYENDMELSYMRESITPLMSGRRLKFTVDAYNSLVTGMSFQVRTVDESRLIENTTITDYEKLGRKITAEVVLKDLIKSNEEYEFVLLISLDGVKDIKYYTRIINPEEYHISDKLEFISDFSNMTFDKVRAEELKKYLESNSKGDNTSFGKVDIHSSFKQVTWGELSPRRLTYPIITIRELAPQTGSFLVDYDVSTSIDGLEKIYRVEEFYRVRYTKDRMYLLDFERTMDEIFVDDRDHYEENAIILGITGNEPTFTESENGTNVAFVSGGRLYLYNMTENTLAYLFRFYDTYTDDVRVMDDRHKIKVVNIDEVGNLTFLVYGYFNRGDHEGESGVSAYYYDASVNTIEELVYIPSTHSPDMIIKEVEQLSYMNSKNVLYLLSGNRLYGIDAKTCRVDTIAENLSKGRYVISMNNHLVSWQQGNNEYDCSSLKLMNLETGVTKEIIVKSHETIMPLAFSSEDLIYGIANKNDITKDRTGNIIVPMNRIKIENEKEGVLLEYAQPEVYVTDGVVNGNQIVLSRMKKVGEGLFEEISDDQIMNAEDTTSTKNSLSHVITDTYEKVTSLVLNKPIDAVAIKHLTPKMVLYEGNRVITLSEEHFKEPFVVYGRYGADSFYADPALAVSRAYEISGSVMDERGEYVYRKTSRSARNQIMAIEASQSAGNKTSLAVCLDAMIENEGVIRNSQYMLNQGDSVMDILSSALPEYSILDLSGCSLDMVLYYVNQDIPVLALLDTDKAMLVVGFNDTEVALMDPEKGEIYKLLMEEAEEMFDSYGDCYITYLPKTEY